MMESRVTSDLSSLDMTEEEPEETSDDLFSDLSLPATRIGEDADSTTASPVFNGRDGAWEPASGRDAESLLSEASDYCRRRCPIFEACVEEACHVYRLEHRAKAYLTSDGPAAAVGVLDEPTMGVV